LVSALLLAGYSSAASAQTPSPTVVNGAAATRSPEPIVQVGLFGYRADGTVSGAAYDTAEPTLGSIVYATASGCSMGAGNRQPPAGAMDAWQFSGRVLSATADEAVVQIDWQRIRAQGNQVSTPGNSVQLTLRAGDRVLLDSASADGTCSYTHTAFEARYEPRRGAFRGVGVGSGGGGGTGVGSRIGVGSGTGGGVGVGSGGRPAAGGLWNVNLWLVRSAPGRKDESTHTALRVTQDGGAFAFPPVRIETALGPVVVQVTGSFRVRPEGPDGQRLVFTTSRRATQASGGTPRDTALSVSGSSTTTTALPGPEEVLAFELPPVRLPNGGEAPDQFSVRLQIAPGR
jgi:hypothetical protein